jgi:hypothetical protein
MPFTLMQLILTREAWEGHAKHGGGGGPKHLPVGRPLHRLRRSPSPVFTGEDHALRSA